MHNKEPEPHLCEYVKCRADISHQHKNSRYCLNTNCRELQHVWEKKEARRKELARRRRLAKKLCDPEFLDRLFELFDHLHPLPIRYAFTCMRLKFDYKISNECESYIVKHLMGRHPEAKAYIKRRS